MICDKIKECAAKTRHVPPEKKKKDKGKKNSNKRRVKEDPYQFPLCKSPCGSDVCQEKCIAFLDRRPQPRCAENGKTYILDQSKKFPRFEVMLYHIDKGVITDPEASTIYKCDYALLVKDSDSTENRGDTVILVELKGGEVKHALKQLQSTLSQKELQPFWDSQKRVFGRIVCRSTPPRIRNIDEYLDVKEALLARHGNLKIREEDMKEEYDELEQR